MKDFKKTKRDEVMKWYFLQSPGQEGQFKFCVTLAIPRVFEKSPFEILISENFTSEIVGN